MFWHELGLTRSDLDRLTPEEYDDYGFILARIADKRAADLKK